ncbi:serine/threonine-protein kinase [Actinomycetospora chiangmaiensis]|uniref:serine/threonine-protein kinase n=1 Tax=Actinomycetospora chiangmaiensis TaxID=402650 RepID=UPI000371B4B6|nr:serine/threonine-protein kinase [Actinomycetospora chiangmaiensis]
MTTSAGATGATAGSTPAGYELGRMLNRGGSGSVHEARQVSTGRWVALKLLDVQVTGPEVHRRFDRERQAMGELAGHPNIVSILDAGVHDGRPWLAMDLCPGGSLADLGRPLQPAEAVSILHAVASALAVTHARGVLHCDIKPGNILVTAYGRPALSDFGIARLTLESQGSRIGGYTLDHVPPEVLRGERPSDRGDVWSLGTTLWQLLAGRPPFRSADDVSAPAVMQRIDRDPLPALGRHDLPPGVESMLRAMTAKNPADRPSAADVAHHAAGIAHGAGLPLEVGLPVSQRTTLPPRTEEPARPLSSTSTVLGPVPTGPPAPEPADPPSGRTTLTKEEKARRRRRRTRFAGAMLVLLLVAFGGGAYVGWRYLPPRQDASPAVAAPASPSTPASAAPVAAGPAAPAPASPTQPTIALKLLCTLKTPTTCLGGGHSQSYSSEVTTLSGQQLDDGCFDYLTVTGPNGVVKQDSFACNSGNPIYLNQNQPLPDGQYRIDERAQTQDGQTALASLTFSVRS